MKRKENSIKVNSRRARIEKMKNIFCRVFRRIDKMAATMARLQYPLSEIEKKNICKMIVTKKEAKKTLHCSPGCFLLIRYS